MDLSSIFQLRTKKFWWMDVIFYFVISLLISTVLCYFVFLIKNGMINKRIDDENLKLQEVGTESQKQQENEVINYQKKIADFTELFNNHEFTSNVFAFMQAQTMPNVWFKQFSLDGRNATIQLSGETDDMGSFSGQVATFEKNKYVKSIGTMNSSIGESAKISFNMNLSLDKSILSYLSNLSLISQASSPSGQPLIQQGQTTPSGETPQSPAVTLSSEKLITSFHLLLNPEVIGVLDETNYNVTLNVSYGTDVKNLNSSIVISPNATVSPASGVQQDFTNPVIYTVIAQDGSIQNYEVTVIIAAPASAVEKPNQSGYVALIIIISIVFVLAVVIGVFFLYRKKLKNKTQI